MSWMNYGQWFDWAAAHTVAGESVPGAAARLVWTYAYCEANYIRNDPADPYEGTARELMCDMLKLQGRPGTRLATVCRAIPRHNLLAIKLRTRVGRVPGALTELSL